MKDFKKKVEIYQIKMYRQNSSVPISEKKTIKILEKMKEIYKKQGYREGQKDGYEKGYNRGHERGILLERNNPGVYKFQKRLLK